MLLASGTNAEKPDNANSVMASQDPVRQREREREKIPEAQSKWKLIPKSNRWRSIETIYLW